MSSKAANSWKLVWQGLAMLAIPLGQSAGAQPYQLQRIDTPNPRTAQFRLVKALPPPTLHASAGENAAQHLAQFQQQIGVPTTCGTGAPPQRSNLYGEFSCPLTQQGSQSLSVTAGWAGEKQRWQVQLPQWPTAQHIIVSDLDDTLIHWPHHSLWRDVLTQNALTRPALNDAADFLRAGAARGAAVVYLSDSPRSLLPEIHGFLRANNLPRGDALFLRPLGLPRQVHKPEVLEALAQYSRATFTLLGDNASADPQIYAAFAARYPQRVQAVHIREMQTEKFMPAFSPSP